MEEKFDLIIVGAGPAGISAAIVAAKAGVKTIVLERGEFPGSKSVFGGVVYAHEINKLIPNFWEDKKCPIERVITDSRIALMNDTGALQIGYKTGNFSDPPNVLTVHRAKFDRWMAKKAQEEGALIICNTCVEEVLRDNTGKVIGVRTGRPDGDVFGKVVIFADGVQSPLTVRAGIRPEVKPEHVALSVKENIQIGEEEVTKRFGAKPGEGVTFEILGTMADKMDGIAIMYTNSDSVSLGIGANLAQWMKSKVTPYEMIDNLKKHPFVAPFVEGGTLKEYTAHWLPEGGWDTIPKLYGNGYMLAGDTAMLFNTLHREGTNLAQATGRMAGEVAAEAIKAGITDEKALKKYSDMVKASFVGQDMKKYKKFGHTLYSNPMIFDQLPTTFGEACEEMLRVDGKTKREKQKIIVKNIRKKVGLMKLLSLGLRGWRAVR
ncbi:MAG TPA: FAD-dependent oxidoreductase [Caldisericia bacterium]|nr:FAD-dependent oxidoreductase [Caldisericia bacterium]HPF48486.1 FAD-dependent oxidoreductase [Caldisericia bacterium]HPI83334.1 FAD-dependent oxidoreductase [Caldisericia bacterium]HPQ92940.1 FAD-dependent oxidoreductase [Caldisericia bacterium]HRV73962.1 FAD-dependent oxidoreductase [Caldisericia bacterium]